MHHERANGGAGAAPHDLHETTNPSLLRLKGRLREFWNTESVYWEPLTEEVAANSTHRAKAASFIPEGSRILDVACGSAANSLWLLPRGKYFGTDISQGGLQRVQRAGLRLTCADAEELPFVSGCFDAVIATYALEHSLNPVRMLHEMHRVVRPGGRIVLLGPTWDLPFWFPNALRSKANSHFWRFAYTSKRLIGQIGGYFLGRSPFLVIEEPDALMQPFICDSDAVYVVWSYEVIRQMKRCGCRLIHCEVDDHLLGSSPPVRTFKKLLMLLPLYRYAGSTLLMVFER